MSALQRRFGEHLVSYQVNYEHVGLTAYEVQSLEDASRLEALHTAQGQEAYKLRKAAEFARGDEASVRRRKSRKQPPRPKRPKPSEAAAAQPHDAAELTGLDDASSGAAELGADGLSDARSSCSELGAALGPEASADHGAALQAADAAAQEALQAAQPALRHDAATGRVLGPGNVYVGRISVIRQGTRQEAVSIYCSRHGCTICKRISVTPSNAEILKWLAQGEEIPAGRTASLQGRHKKLFPSG